MESDRRVISPWHGVKLSATWLLSAWRELRASQETFNASKVAKFVHGTSPTDSSLG
jgi:predicted DNA-binding transcriptional regulator YafY